MIYHLSIRRDDSFQTQNPVFQKDQEKKTAMCWGNILFECVGQQLPAKVSDRREMHSYEPYILHLFLLLRNLPIYKWRRGKYHRN